MEIMIIIISENAHGIILNAKGQKQYIKCS